MINKKKNTLLLIILIKYSLFISPENITKLEVLFFSGE